MKNPIDWLKDKAYGIVAPLAIVGIYLTVADHPITDRLENLTVDWRFNQAHGTGSEQESEELYLFEIDQPSFDRLGGWPWPRNVPGGLLYLLDVVNPSAVGMDVIFADRRELRRDNYLAATARADSRNEYLAESLNKLGRVVLAGYAQEDVQQGARQGKIDLGKTRALETVIGDVYQVPGTDQIDNLLVPLPLLRYESHIGFTDTAPTAGGDNTRRRMPMVVRIEDKLYASFVTQLLLRSRNLTVDSVTVVLGSHIIIPGDNPLRIPINDRGELLINYSTPVSVPSSSFFKIAEDLYANKNEGTPFPDDFPKLENKIIVTAVTVQGLMDQATTPLGSGTPPVYTHLQALDNILNEDYLSVLSRNNTIFGFLLICWLTILPFSTERVSFILGIPMITLLAFTLVVLYFFNFQNLIIPAFWTSVGFMLVHLGALVLNWIRQMYSKQQLRSVFANYMDDAVMDNLLENQDNIKLGGVRKPVTILFSDIRSFTTLSESMDEETLVTQLNEYFEEMVGAVNDHKGTLHKFIGDAVMAVWGDVISESEADDARNSLKAALSMRKRLVTLNKQWSQDGRPEFHIGIGLNHGPVLVGNIGAKQRKEFTVIGDAVNLAARLEGVTKQYRTDLIIGENVYELVEDDFLCRPVGSLIVKGKTKPVTAYEVLHAHDEPSEKWDPEVVAIYKQAYQEFLNRDFKAAKDHFIKFKETYSEDYITDIYLDASDAYILYPPDESWNGTVTLKTK
ncbi:MAG: adenylate/guanylate cyclase domain-containing protein [Verrucomicrobiota bacterium]